MTRYTTSRPDSWTLPKRTFTDADRKRFYGPILPMEDKGFLAKWLGRK